MDKRDTAAESIPPSESGYEPAGPGLAKAKEDNLRLTNEEIQQIISSQQEQVEAVLEEGRVLTSSKKPQEIWDWDSDDAIRTLLQDRYESLFGRRKTIHISAIQELAHRHMGEIVKREGIKAEKVIHRAGRKGSIKEFYFKPFAVALRKMLLEFMQREPGLNEVQVDGELLADKGAGLLVVQRITEYMKRKEVGTIHEYLDKRGFLGRFCDEEDVPVIQRIYAQVKIRRGFRDPKDLVALLRGKRKRKNSGAAYTLEDIKKQAEKYRAQDPEWFRPALNSGGAVIESISEDLYELLKCHFTKVKKPRSGSMTLQQIQKEYSIPIGVPAIRLAANKMGCRQGKDVYVYEGPDGVTRYYYSPEFTEKLIEEIRRNQEK